MIIDTGRLKEISEIEFGDTPTFPKHFHNGSEDAVAPSYIPDDTETALREFLKFAKEALKKLNDKKD